MKKRFFSMFCALCLALTLLPPMTAQAAESSPVQKVYIGGNDSTGVRLDESTPYYHNRADGAIGTADNDPTDAHATFDASTGTLTLNGLDIRTNDKGIWWEYDYGGKHDLTIVLAEGYINTVENTTGVAINGERGVSYGPSLTIEGSGTLNVFGSTSGIWVWQNITIQGDAKVNVNGTTKFGICNNSSFGTITVKGNAEVTVDGGTYGIGYDNYNMNANVPVIQGGTVTIKGGTAAVMEAPDLSGYTVRRVTVGDAAPGTDWDNTTLLSTYKYIKIEPTDHTHNWSDTWNYDDTYHWHECGNAGCYVIEDSNKDGYAVHTGGTATCKDKAICSECSQPYGSKDSSNHTGGTVILGQTDATATTPGYTGNTYCRGCNTQIGTGERISATGNTGGSNNLESITFGYAYDAQKELAYPKGIGSLLEFSDLDKPLLENGSRKDDNTGDWKLTKAGTYSYLKTYLKNNNKDTSNLESVVSAVIDKYGWSVEQKNRSVIYELKDGETHIAYGIIIAYDTGKERAVFVGDNKPGGAGYLFSKRELNVSPGILGHEVTAVMIAWDFVVRSEYQMIEGMNGKWTQDSNGTLSFRADGAFDQFIGVMVDDSLLDAQNYTVASGSTIVTLKEDYLRTLSVGSHRLTVFYNDGECVTFFEIQPGVNDSGNGNGTSDSGSSNNSPASDNNDHSNDSPATPDNTVSEKPAIVIHIVQKGDTLRAIARKYGCSVAEIKAANSKLIKNVNLIYPGWQLKIPQTGVNANQTNTQQQDVLSNDRKTQVYIVQRGDNLWKISRKHGCTIAEIIALNSRLAANPNLLYAGWELKLPQR